MTQKFYTEMQLAALARRYRKEAGVTRAQAARDMVVSQTSIFHAEESPKQGLVKLRSRMIERYSAFEVSGPVFYLIRKTGKATDGEISS